MKDHTELLKEIDQTLSNAEDVAHGEIRTELRKSRTKIAEALKEEGEEYGDGSAMPDTIDDLIQEHEKQIAGIKEVLRTMLLYGVDIDTRRSQANELLKQLDHE